MRHLKMMGLTLLVVFALVALAGATTASATKLCQTNTSPCGSAYPANTAFHADLRPGTSFVITTSGSPTGFNPAMTCSGSTWGLTSTGAGGGAGVAVPVRLTALSVTSCTSAGPTGCESSATVGALTGATGQVAWTSGVNGTLTIAPPTMTWNCPILGTVISCTYGGSGTLDSTITGGASPPIEFVNQSIASTGGFGCPTTAQWNFQLTVTKSLFVTNS